MTRFRDRICYLWRLLATGISFALFGLGGTLIAVPLFLLIYLAPLRKHKKKLYAQQAVSVTFRIYIGFICLCGLVTYELNGRESLRDKGLLIIANHPSLLDVVFLISFLNHTNCIVKGGLWRNPFTRIPIVSAGYIKNDAKQLVDECVQCLNRGESLIVFPEGTRSGDEASLTFLRGTANIALMAKHDITPVVIQCTPSALRKGDKWYSIATTPPHFSFDVCQGINIAPFLDPNAMQSKKSRELTRYLENYFGQKLATNLESSVVQSGIEVNAEENNTKICAR